MNQCFTTNTTGDIVHIQALECIFANVLQVVLAFGGIVLFIMLLAGGFQYITAGGNPQGVEAAKKTLTYAIAGIILLALSFLILALISKFTNVDVTKFQVVQ